MNDTETTSIQIEQYIPHPPGKVWRALTEPGLLERWWAPGDISPSIGHQFTMDMGQWGLQPCTVLEVEHERRIVYSFTDYWTLSWRLEPEGDGTRLFFEHSGFDLTKPMDQQAFKAMGDGWESTILPALARVSGEI